MNMIHIGNAAETGRSYRGWMLGPYVEAHPVSAVQVKYTTHEAGESRRAWAPGDTATSLAILISDGAFILRFRDREVRLHRPGDYVMWGPGIEHTWSADAPCTVVTVRWVEPASNSE